VPVTTADPDEGGFASYRWLPARRAAQLLGIPIRQLYMLIDHGHLPGYKIGGEIRLLAHDVEALRDRFRDRRGD
jgi:excisionase family DNA binding protein